MFDRKVGERLIQRLGEPTPGTVSSALSRAVCNRSSRRAEIDGHPPSTPTFVTGNKVLQAQANG